MRIGELARRCGLSVDTLRYYEKLGLIDPPWRTGGKRHYGEDILPWLSFLGALKATGMPLAEMTTYAHLRRQGEATSAERRAMLEHQREIVRARMERLGECLTLLDYKIDNYVRIEARHAASDRRNARRAANG